MLFPRVAAVAEVGWTKSENKDYKDFSENRLPKFLKNIEESGVNYRIPEADVVINDCEQTGRKKIMITPFVAGIKLYYTIDGHKADNTANLYSGPILTPYTNGRPLTLNYIIVTAGNRASNEFSVDIK